MHKLATGLAFAAALTSATPAPAAGMHACWLKDATSMSYVLREGEILHLNRVELKPAQQIVIEGRLQIACLIDFVSMSMRYDPAIRATHINEWLQFGMQTAPSQTGQIIPLGSAISIVAQEQNVSTNKEPLQKNIGVLFGVRCIIEDGRISIQAIQAKEISECQE